MLLQNPRFCILQEISWVSPEFPEINIRASKLPAEPTIR